MKENLTETQSTIYNLLPATAVEIASAMGYSGTTTVYDHISSIRNRGFEVGQNQNDEYLPLGESKTPDTLNVSAPNRTPPSSKQTITRKAGEYMAELEDEIKAARQEVGPAIADGGMPTLGGNMDVIVPCYDDHYGDVVTDKHGVEIFNADILSARIERKFDLSHDSIEIRQEMGQDVDVFTIILGGDHVTNEAIYDGQWQHIREKIDSQLNKATQTYFDEIKRASKLYPAVQVVCNHGNHGEFRVKGSSQTANADDFMYDRLEMLCVAADLDNVTFVRSDRDDAVNFPIRGGKEEGGYRGHVRHGQNVNSHIGTSSPQNTWKGYHAQTGFDAGWRGHYHERRVEPVNGRPVYMVPSLKDMGEYEERLGIVTTHPMGSVMGVTDDALPAWEDFIHYQ